MSFRALLIHRLSVTNFTVTDPPATDRYGNPIPEEDSFNVRGRVQPVGSQEDIVDRDTRITRFLIFLPAGTNVSGTSVLTWDDPDNGSRSLRVHGEPRTFAGRRRPHHIELDAEEVLG